MLFALIHLCTCIWIGFSGLHDPFQPLDWMDLYHDWESIYIQGFQYTTTTLAAIGAGDNFVRTSQEMIVSQALSIFGVAIFAMIIQQIQYYFRNESGDYIYNEENNINLWLSLRESQIVTGHLSVDLLTLMNEFTRFHYTHNHRAYFSQNKIFHSLSARTACLLQNYLFEHFCKTFHTFFDGIEEPCAHRIIRELTPVVNASKTIMILPNEKSPGVFFIVNGVVQVKGPSNKILTRLKETSFGEHALLEHANPFRYTVGEKVNLGALFISSQRLKEILIMFPLARAHLHRLARTNEVSLYQV
jgi:hypothetical protein